DLGEIATGLNRNPNDAKMGLQILCNKHINLRNDIIINIDYDFPNINDHGVRQYQGDPALSAGNEFSLIGQLESDIYNHSPWTINYYHSGGITKPNNYTSSKVNVQPITTENSCPSRFG